MNTDKSSIYTVQTIVKAFELLEILSDSNGDTSLAYLCSRVGMTRNKVYRILATLCENGLIEHEPYSDHYGIGISAVSFAQKVLRNSSVVNLAHPIIEELAKRHDEAVYMTVIRGDEVLFLDMADCEQQIKAISLVGKTFPYFTNAAGKVIKALESRELPEWLCKKKSKNTHDVPDPQKLVSELLEIRSNGGVAVDCGGLGEGISSVAVAVKDYAGKVIGAVTLLGPSFRIVRDRIENEILPSLIEGAAMVSEKFGYMPA